MRILVTGGSGFIGTNFVERNRGKDQELVNVDLRAPLNPSHLSHWKECDIMEARQLSAIFDDFQPTHVLHMAARTDCEENTTVEEGYAVNTTGTENVLGAIKQTPSIERAIIVSTQYVAGPSRLPLHDQDYFPHTVYGQSKVIAEQLTRQADLQCVWTLVRPTNIWGPWHLRYRREAWRVIDRGMYMHPGGKQVTRTYGYVGNVVWQLEQILKAPRGVVDKQVLYLGDRPDDIYKWVNEFSLALRGKPARRVPRAALAPIGWVGDGLAKIGKQFPLTSSRFNNMISDYPANTAKTFDMLGEPPYSLKEGVEETVIWLNQVGWEHPS